MSEPRRALERAGFCSSIADKLVDDLRKIEVADVR
jgi:hypothetical protein